MTLLYEYTKLPSILTYLIFVNFGTPPHYLGLKKVHQKVREFATN